MFDLPLRIAAMVLDALFFLSRSQFVAKIAKIFGERRGKAETLGEFRYGIDRDN